MYQAAVFGSKGVLNIQILGLLIAKIAPN